MECEWARYLLGGKAKGLAAWRASPHSETQLKPRISSSSPLPRLRGNGWTGNMGVELQ
jgi:hypothetical protein